MPNSTSLTDRLSGWKTVGEPTSENSDKTSECRHNIQVVSGSHWAQQEAESSGFWSLPSPARVAWSVLSRVQPITRCNPLPVERNCQELILGAKEGVCFKNTCMRILKFSCSTVLHWKHNNLRLPLII